MPHAKQPEREPCVICGEDMNMVIETLECGHRYHSTVSSYVFSQALISVLIQLWIYDYARSVFFVCVMVLLHSRVQSNLDYPDSVGLG